ncbi:MAG: hypothetical protein ABL907_01525 [Hyphomicrobium sp.]
MNITSWRDMIARIETDPDYPAHRQTTDASRIRSALNWSAAPTATKARSVVKIPSPFETQPFNRQTIRKLFASLCAADLRRADKTLENAQSDCNFVADFFGLGRGIAWATLTDDCASLLPLVTNKWDRPAIQRFFRYLSWNNFSPWLLTPEIASGYQTALADQFGAADPVRRYDETELAWKKLIKTAGWPKFEMPRRPRRQLNPLDWSIYSTLEAEIDAYLACGRRDGEIDNDLANDDSEEGEEEEDTDTDADLDGVDPLSASSLSGNKSKLRVLIAHLRDDGLKQEELKSLRDICKPARFIRALRCVRLSNGDKVDYTVMGYAHTLFRAARHPGVLTPQEIKNVRKTHRKYCVKHRHYLKTHHDRDQDLLDQLDDPAVMDAFLSLPTRTKNSVMRRRNRHTIGCAYAIQRALILELWFCAPYRIGAFASIELDQVLDIELGGIMQSILRAPTKQSHNKRSPEHFLNDDTVALLRLYVEVYRNIILRALKSPASPFLFPGRHNKVKHTASLRFQMTNYVRKNTSLKTWHPHAMRKVVPKITLDQDPGALEVARRTGGWANTRMLEKIYGQRVHRATQAKYNELLEERRFAAKKRAPGKRRK